MSVSRIKDHKVRSGKVISPWNHAMGNTMTFSSWAFTRLPEYIWLCLIHNYYGRDEGLRRAALILKELSTFEKSLDKPKLSKILALHPHVQDKVYRTILNRKTRDTHQFLPEKLGTLTSFCQITMIQCGNTGIFPDFPISQSRLMDTSARWEGRHEHSQKIYGGCPRCAS